MSETTGDPAMTTTKTVPEEIVQCILRLERASYDRGRSSHHSGSDLPECEAECEAERALETAILRVSSVEDLRARVLELAKRYENESAGDPPGEWDCGYNSALSVAARHLRSLLSPPPKATKETDR